MKTLEIEKRRKQMTTVNIDDVQKVIQFERSMDSFENTFRTLSMMRAWAEFDRMASRIGGNQIQDENVSKDVAA